MKRFVARVCLPVLVMVAIGACTKNPPPNVTPAQFTANHVVSALEVAKAAAIAANLQSPKLLSDANLQIVEQAIVSAETTVNQAPSGWKATVTTALEQLPKNMPAAEYAPIAKYVTAAIVIIQLVA